MHDPTPAFRITVDRHLNTETRLSNPRPSYTYDEILEKMHIAWNASLSKEGCKQLLIRGAEKVGEDKYSFSHDLKTNIPAGFYILSAQTSEIMAQNIECPVCFIKGDPGADYEPREDLMKLYEKLEKHVPHAEFHLVSGTHHFHLDVPEIVGPIIDKFLNHEEKGNVKEKTNK